MTMVTIAHKNGQITVHKNYIDCVEKQNERQMLMIGGPNEGEVTNHEVSYSVKVKEADIIDDTYILTTYILTEGQYNSLVEKLTSCS